MKSILRFDIEKLKKLTFRKIISGVFYGDSAIFFWNVMKVIGLISKEF